MGRSCSHAGRGLRSLRACGLCPGQGSGYTELPFLCCVHISVAQSLPLGKVSRHPRVACPASMGRPATLPVCRNHAFPQSRATRGGSGNRRCRGGESTPPPTPAETFPSSTLVYRWGGRGPERVRSRHRVTQQHKKGLDPGGLRLARPACQISRCHGPDGCLLCNFLLLRICVFIYMFCQVPFLYYL